MDPCDIHLQAASYAAEACGILTKELFAPCYPYLSPVPYFEQCRRDTCKCGQVCFCSALAHYAHHCRRFGVVIDFRGGVPDCALSCEDTKEYSTCVSTCGRTCQALSVPETCSSDCVEGCACPSGMYLNSKTDRCVQRNECPCYFQGIDYPPGENVMTSLGKCHCRDGVMNCDNNIIAHGCPAGQIYINCSNPQVDPELSRERTCENQLLNLTFSAHIPCISGCVCPPGLPGAFNWRHLPFGRLVKRLTSHLQWAGSVCQHGSFQCSFHPCPSMCTAYGDRHYRTFDGLTFDFVGTCKVYLVKGTSSTTFSVIIENINCFNTGVICRKNIFINVGKSFLIFDDETGNPSLSSYIDDRKKIQLWKAGFFTVVHFPDEHVTILWDQRTTVHVQMGHRWQGKLTGLCGNFDLKTVNELRTPDNFELTNSQEFGNSWTAVECVDSSDIRNPCSLNPLREPFAKKECGILLSEAFEACHPVIDVTWFYSNCLTDTCGCNQGGDCECFCTSVSAYAHQCCQHGVAVDWRSPRVCPYDCDYFNKALGKGPYKLVSYLDEEFVMAVRLVDGVVFPVREEDIVLGHAASFMLTSGLYKPKAHDSNLISFEAADRPNYFLQLASNNTLVLSKWEKREMFHNRSTFIIHKNTWLSGYSSFESFAKPGYFIHISSSSVDLLKYHHSEEYRLSTLFKLVDVKFRFLSRSACEWHYDACTSPCFKTCRDPLGKTCQAVPKVEGCVPACPLNMLLDEITQRCVYFEDCIEPADDSPPLPPSIHTPAVSEITSSTSLAVISEAVSSFPVPEVKDMETTLASKLPFTATTGKTEFSALTSITTLPTITLSSNISSQSTEMTSGRSTTAMSGTTKSNFHVPSKYNVVGYGPFISCSLSLFNDKQYWEEPAPSVSSFAYLSTKPLYGLTTTFSDGLATAETMSGVTASALMLPKETATLQTCTPITENECVKHICLNGQLIQVNKSQNCPYNATQHSCGVLGFAAQVNGDKCCPKWECACRCTIFSDLSIVTYDGNHLALFKEASYIVSQTRDETISIHVLDCKMSNSNSTSLCLAMLNLTYVSNQIIINRLSRKITVNSRFAWPTVRKYGFKVEDSGFKYAVETPTKIRIQWFHNTGVMIIEFNSTREPRPLGLCGFCDRSLENDLMLPNGTVLSKSDPPLTFIDSWQVPGTLKYVGRDRHQETNCSIMDCSECLRLVLNQTFSSCHPYVPPELFCNMWAQDTEYIQNPCISLAAYVAMCNKFNICIEWRSSDYCPFPCSENFSYQACIAACEVADSCHNNEVASLDSDSCSLLTEGCVCAAGTILHRAHTAVCIPEEKCACTDSSGAPHAVGEIWKTSLSGCCMQKCVDSETIVPVEHNCSDIHNLDCQRFAEVALLVPDDHTCCPQKICICNQSLCEPLIPECNDLEKLVTYYNEESCCPNYVCECDPAKCEPVEQMPSCQDDQTLVASRVESTCCISYICACGACSDRIPKCQEGEVLIVDGNTTERCCPTYQCICEIHRCPEFKCMLGMSLVEGQKLQIDEQFQNSTENTCNCVKYICVRDKVCLSNERGVLRPGQTIVEHSADGICHVSYCTNVIDPSTKYYRINRSSIDCAVKCKANQVYQPPKDLTTCCGSCKNLSCLHTFSNGTVSNFKPGTVWISNCIRYECTNTAIGPVLVSSSVGCPPFNETECVKVGGYVVPFLEGCCKTCKEDGKFCKKVTVRMTIRKNDCRSNTPRFPKLSLGIDCNE
ncbi:otogelin [Patagioenas fasciata monilis]|uniref:Otogelin n=1 Tax=Patagioenas fasciata monilis TaxID=372326 RepID=A0A1V4JQ08_PATFA|nr:otogelin [Patagioenas fasciata monilis]